ncbi:triphosphoribosyl-dephospho-CoA synthase MdcB [Achromobacter aloeverae]
MDNLIRSIPRSISLSIPHSVPYSIPDRSPLPGLAPSRPAVREAALARDFARLAKNCLDLEVATYPKPGLVSHIDRGAHRDMDAALLHLSAACLLPYFEAFVHAGLADADMVRLREIGLAAEACMLDRTGGVNTHRGAIFGMGLLLAAAGLRHASNSGLTLGQLVAQRWGRDILDGPASAHSHGGLAQRRYGASGARGQAASGFPAIYRQGLPALRAGMAAARGNHHDARVHLCFSLIATLEDTNLLHRGGPDGLRFAQAAAREFLEAGGIAAAGWRERAVTVHRAFVARHLSPGGGADLLGMTLLVQALEPGARRVRRVFPVRSPGGATC